MRHDIEPLHVTVERKEGRQAWLRLSDKQELVVPIHYLPRNVRTGDTIELKFFTPDQARADKTELARLILEELLNDPNEPSPSE